jgi:hypothetical protein
MLAGAAISWRSRKQPTVALSVAEAEYMSLTMAAQETVWWRLFLSDLGLTTAGPTDIFSDSQGAIAIAKKTGSSGRTKHIDVKYHYVRQQFEEGTINVKHVSTNDQVADGLTKPLPKIKHQEFINYLGMSTHLLSGSNEQ